MKNYIIQYEKLFLMKKNYFIICKTVTNGNIGNPMNKQIIFDSPKSKQYAYACYLKTIYMD